MGSPVGKRAYTISGASVRLYALNIVNRAAFKARAAQAVISKRTACFKRVDTFPAYLSGQRIQNFGRRPLMCLDALS